MRPRVILHTIETGGPGGAETVLLRLATALEPSRFTSVALVSREGWLKQRLEEARVPTFVASGTACQVARTINRIVRKEGVALVHSHLPGQNFYSCLASWVNGTKVIATYHGEIELAGAGSGRGALKLWVVRRSADAITVVADRMYKRLLALGVPADKLSCIYNGIDVEHFSALPAGRLRSELELTAGVPVVGTVANVRQSKGHEYLIRCAPGVLERFPEAHFVVAGDVPEHLGGPLRQLVHDLGLQDRFHFLGFRQDAASLMKDFDVFVLPSISEGLPLVVLEAMAASKAMVVTRSGGPEDVVEDGRTGLLVASADAAALSEAICRLLADTSLAETLGRNARATVETRFSLPRMIGEYQDLYERCLGLVRP